MSSFKAACIQLNGGANIEANIEQTSQLIKEAAGKGASLILTPENTDLMCFPLVRRMKLSQSEEDHPAIPAFADLAGALGISLIIGSVTVKLGPKKLANRCYVFSNDGKLAAKYDKIHMFDVDLPNKESYRESRVIEAGKRAVVYNDERAQIGLSICYDLRFPYLYRDMAKAGAEILSVPAAFTVPTGQAHWMTLLRARAIETGCYVLAAGQEGEHDGGRKTWGQSMIVGPWGDVIAERKEAGPGIIMADIDLQKVEDARAAIPALKHDREYAIEHIYEQK